MAKNILEENLFPYSKLRKIQDEMILDIDSAIKNKNNIIVHAPTGLGKTVAALSPALSFALKNKLTVFFLTSRQTQHRIAVNTLKEIKKRHKIDFVTIDIIGKKWMCPVPGIDGLYSNEFNEYCKAQREENKCEFYSNLRKKSSSLTVKAKQIIEELKEICPYHVEEIIKVCETEKLCPYEISAILAKEATVIIADYNYLFNPSIRDVFFSKSNKNLENSIIIIDEGHNLGKRARELLTQRLSNFMLERAVKEAKKFDFEETSENLIKLNGVLMDLASSLNEDKEERMINKDEFIETTNQTLDYDELISQFQFTGDEIKELQKQSYVGSIGKFLESWPSSDNGFARILSKTTLKRPLITLSHRCLDPSLITRDIIENSYSSIIMSGTLTPTFMYKDILGFPSASIEKNYKNPFPKENRLNLIIPETTTKFTKRNPEQYKEIAKNIHKIIENVPGNSAAFFPSYQLRDFVLRYLKEICQKNIFIERQGLIKEEKELFLDKFKKKKDSILLGAATGNFGEGIDLPGVLKAVIIVGIPLEKPNLETKELISYYNTKFGKGWEYGYILPAITRCMQNAGRCIRSEKDKGVIVFLDERFAWNNYYKCFPLDWNVEISKLYDKRIKSFFENST